MGEGESSIKAKVSIGIVSVEGTRTFRSFSRRKLGPFVIINRSNGLALDTGLHEHNGAEPIMWHPHGYPHQQWHFLRTQHWGEYVIVSAANKLALDARTYDDLSRTPCMWGRHAERHQRWRFGRSDDGLGYVIQSVATGHALDFPDGTTVHDIPHLYTRHGDPRQQFLIASLTSGGFAETG
ncbi:RICIN domain-containing protein [Lentzea sp. NPDC055074]